MMKKDGSGLTVDASQFSQQSEKPQESSNPSFLCEHKTEMSIPSQNEKLQDLTVYGDKTQRVRFKVLKGNSFIGFVSGGYDHIVFKDERLANPQKNIQL